MARLSRVTWLLLTLAVALASAAQSMQITYDESISRPQWLEDGRRVALVRRRTKEMIGMVLLAPARETQHRVELLVIDVDTGEQVPLRRWDAYVSLRLIVSPTRPLLAWAEPKGLFLRDLASGAEHQLADAPGRLAFTPDGKALVFQPREAAGRVSIHDLGTGQARVLVEGDKGGTFFLSSDGEIVVEGYAIGRVYSSEGAMQRALWWSELVEVRERALHSQPSFSLSLSPDRRRGAGVYGHSLYLRDASGVKKIATFDTRARLSHQQQTAEERFLATPGSPAQAVAAVAKESGLRPYALDALLVHGRQSIDAAVAALDHESLDVQRLGASALAELASPDDRALLAKGILHPRKTARFWFLQTLLRRDPLACKEAINRILQQRFDPKRESHEHEAQRTLIERATRHPDLVAPETLRQALRHPMYPIQWAAIGAMARSGDAAFVPDLMAFLVDGPEHVKDDAALALLRLGSDAGAPLLHAELEDPRRGESLAYSVRMLVEAGGGPSWACPLLLRYLENAARRRWAPSAAIFRAWQTLFRLTGRSVGPLPGGNVSDAHPMSPPALEEIAAWRRWWEANRTKRPAELIIPALLSPGPHPPGFQGSLLTALRVTIVPEDASLVRKLAASNDSHVRDFARRTLEYLEAGGVPPHARRKTPAAPDPLEQNPELARLLAALRSDDPKAREDAARALRQMRHPAAMAGLLAAARDGDPLVSQAAVVALLRLGKSAVAPLVTPIRAQSEDEKKEPTPQTRAIIGLLAGGLADGDRQVREAATRALADTRHPLAIGPLIAATRDTDKQVRLRAVLGLFWTEDARILQPLVERLDDESPEVRRRAVQQLAKLGDPAAIPRLVEMLKTGAPMDKHAAASALATLKARAATDTLLTMLEGPNRMLQHRAVACLARIADPRSTNALIGALSSPDKYVRNMAAEGLGAIGDKRAVDPLLERLKDKEWEVRYQTAEALGEIGDPRAIEPLLQALLHDEGADVPAAKALVSMGGPRIIEALIDALDEKGKSNRELVGWALKKITGQDLKASAAAWRQWWQKHKDDFRPRASPAGGEDNR